MYLQFRADAWTGTQQELSHHQPSVKWLKVIFRKFKRDVGLILSFIDDKDLPKYEEVMDKPHLYRIEKEIEVQHV